MPRTSPDMSTAPVHSRQTNTEAAVPAPSNEQGHRLSTTNFTATGTPVGSEPGLDLPTAAEVLREALGVRLQAEESLRAADPLTVEAHELGFQLGFQLGVVEGERRAGERAEKAADGFLSYLAEDPAATPGEIPPLQRTHRHLGVAA